MRRRGFRCRFLHGRPGHALVLRNGFARKQYWLVTGGRPELLRANRLRRTRRHDFGGGTHKAIIRPARIAAGISPDITPRFVPSFVTDIAASVTPIAAAAAAPAAAVAVAATIPVLRIGTCRRIRGRTRTDIRLTLFFLIRGWR